MIFFVVIAIAVVIISLLNSGDIGDFILLLLANTMLGVILSFGLVLISTYLWGPRLDIITTDTEYELAQINDHSYADTEGGIAGNMFLVSGYITTDLKAGYSYYQKEGDGYVLKTVDASDATIKYTTEAPRVVESYTHCDGEHGFSTLGAFTSNVCEIGDGYVKYTFYIPDGSIVSNYKLGSEE